MQTVLDNMTGGVMLFDKDFQLQFINRQVIEFQGYPPELTRRGTPGRDILRFQIERGDFGEVADTEAKIDERVGFITMPGGNRFTRQTVDGRYVEFTFQPIARRRRLAFGRDVTRLKEREKALADAKEAAERARDDVERTRAVMQPVLDNMSDGVTLLDKDFLLAGSATASASSSELPPDLLKPGVSGHDDISHSRRARRFRPDRGHRAPVQERVALIQRPDGAATSSAPRAAQISNSPSCRSRMADCSGLRATSPS